MKKIYIAGKTGSLPDQKTFKKFQIVEQIIRNAGFDVINPVTILPAGETNEEAIEILKPYLIYCDYILLLPDFLESKRADSERELFIEFAKPIINFNEMIDFFTGKFIPKPLIFK